MMGWGLFWTGDVFFSLKEMGRGKGGVRLEEFNW